MTVDCYLRDLRDEQYRDGILEHDQTSALSKDETSPTADNLNESAKNTSVSSLDVAVRNKLFAEKVSRYTQ